MICKICKQDFNPLYHNGILKSKYCIACLLKKVRAKKKQDWSKEKKERKEKLRSHSDWLKELQKVFNEFIRLRDKGKPCISCGRTLVGKFDAGHFMSVGAYPNLRFNEDNVFGQCVHCNQHKHGNISEYSIQLPLRIGMERYEKLLEVRNEPLKLTVPEIREKIEYYKVKIKELKKDL